MLYTAKLGKNSENIGENRGKSENFGENRGIFEENARKIGEFSRNPFLEVVEPAVVSGHFRSFSQSFPVIPGHFPIDSD